MKQYTGVKHTGTKAGVESGVSESAPLDPGALRNEGQGQRPEVTTESAKNGHKFKH